MKALLVIDIQNSYLNSQKITERLYELRKNKNISQEELAELLDVSRQSISKWEKDKAYPEMTRLLFMSEYFDVSLDYLMRGTDSEESNNDLTVGYKAQNMLRVWNNFISNLSDKQRTLSTSSTESTTGSLCSIIMRGTVISSQSM